MAIHNNLVLKRAADIQQCAGLALGQREALDGSGSVCMLGALDRAVGRRRGCDRHPSARKLAAFLKRRTLGVEDEYNGTTIDEHSGATDIIAAYSNMRVPVLAKSKGMKPGSYAAWIMRKAAEG